MVNPRVKIRIKLKAENKPTSKALGELQVKV
jgi:hypothetical protein